MPTLSTQPPSGLIAASYARFSSDMQDPSSTSTQQCSCRERAEKNEHRVLSEFEFSDEAVSGTKLHRDGLDALLAAAAAGKFQVLYFFSLSRLARESVIAMPILKKLVYVDRVRIISVTEGVDSANADWELLATFLCLQHEKYVKELAQNVFRGQAGNFQAGNSNGDHCFGYRSQPAPGSENARRGRHARPRMVHAIDPVISAWVLLIFFWFVRERRSLTWIARELNRLGAPKDHRSTTKPWRAQYVASVLRNKKYIGLWSWGKKKNVRNPLTGKVSQEERPDEEQAKWRKHMPHLQLIDNETFEQARVLLEENAKKSASRRDPNGQLRGSRSGDAANHPRHLLSGLVICRHCGRTFYVGGTNGKYLFCPGYKMGVCLCQTTLRRDRAERLILRAISQEFMANAAWRQSVFEFTLEAWKMRDQHLPGETAAKEAALAEVERRIEKLLDHLEDAKLPDADIKSRLAQRREERDRLLRELKPLRNQLEQRRPEPTMEWVSSEIAKLHEVLLNGGPAAAHALRDLVGGRIVVEEIRREGKKRHFLRGKFTLRTSAIVSSLGPQPAERPRLPEAFEEVVVIDFVDPDPLDALAEKVKECYDRGLLGKQIAAELQIFPSRVCEALERWQQLHGQELPDGRKRRASLAEKCLKTPTYKAIADAVKQLWDDPAQLAMLEIARRLEISDTMAWKALKHWHRSRSLPAPSAKDRLQRVWQRALQMYDDQFEIVQIAEQLGYTARGVKLMLKRCLANRGEKMPDGRSRRHSRRKAG